MSISNDLPKSNTTEALEAATCGLRKTQEFLPMWFNRTLEQRYRNLLTSLGIDEPKERILFLATNILHMIETGKEIGPFKWEALVENKNQDLYRLLLSQKSSTSS